MPIKGVAADESEGRVENDNRSVSDSLPVVGDLWREKASGIRGGQVGAVELGGVAKKEEAGAVIEGRSPII